MNDITYQIERAPVGTESWEQTAPTLTREDHAQVLCAARRIENEQAPATQRYRYRIVATERRVLAKPSPL